MGDSSSHFSVNCLPEVFSAGFACEFRRFSISAGFPFELSASFDFREFQFRPNLVFRRFYFIFGEFQFSAGFSSIIYCMDLSSHVSYVCPSVPIRIEGSSSVNRVVCSSREMSACRKGV